jgi:hypothetical protein
MWMGIAVSSCQWSIKHAMQLGSENFSTSFSSLLAAASFKPSYRTSCVVEHHDFCSIFFFWRYIFEVPKPTRYIFNKLNSSFSKVLVKFFRPSSRGFSLYWTCSANACKDTWRLPVHKRRQCWFTIPLRLGHRASYSLEGLHAPPCLRTARVCLKSLF